MEYVRRLPTLPKFKSIALAEAQDILTVILFLSLTPMFHYNIIRPLYTPS